MNGASEEGGRLIAASGSGQKAEADSHGSKCGAVEAGEAAVIASAQALQYVEGISSGWAALTSSNSHAIPTPHTGARSHFAAPDVSTAKVYIDRACQTEPTARDLQLERGISNKTRALISALQVLL